MKSSSTTRTSAVALCLFLICAALSVSGSLLQRSEAAAMTPPASTSNAAAIHVEPAPASATANLLGAITVNSTSDVANGTDGLCTLREAIIAANTDAASGATAGECTAGSGDDIITITVSGTVTLLSALPNLSTLISITGPGANQLTVQRSTASGTPNFRIFTTSGFLTVKISGMTMTNGMVTNGEDGGAIFNQNGTSLTLTNVTLSGNATGDASSIRAGFGGAVLNRGTLNLISSTVSGNVTGKGAFGGSPQGGDGGGVYNNGAAILNVANSTINGNATGNGITAGSSGNHDGYGGGVYNAGTATFVNSTISNNTTSTGNSNSAGGQGAGIHNGIGATLTVQNCTIAGNIASNGVGGSSGGGLNGGGTVRNTIIANNIRNEWPGYQGIHFAGLQSDWEHLWRGVRRHDHATT